MAERWFYARRPFGYMGVELDREQVFKMVGAINDEKLERLGYCVPFDPKASQFSCRYCPAKFISLAALEGHGRKRHEPEQPLPPPPQREAGESVSAYRARLLTFQQQLGDNQDAKEEAEDARVNAEAPLHLDKTAANRS